MFSTTIKRSVATLGVVAGLLAAAVPASAQILDGPVLAKAKAGGISGEEMSKAILSVKAPSTEQAFDNTPMDEVVFSAWNNGDGNDTSKAEGTQVGSEGVKGNNGAPGREPISGWLLGGTQTGTMHFTKYYDMASPY